MIEWREMMKPKRNLSTSTKLSEIIRRVGPSSPIACQWHLLIAVQLHAVGSLLQPIVRWWDHDEDDDDEDYDDDDDSRRIQFLSFLTHSLRFHHLEDESTKDHRNVECNPYLQSNSNRALLEFELIELIECEWMGEWLNGWERLRLRLFWLNSPTRHCDNSN